MRETPLRRPTDDAQRFTATARQALDATQAPRLRGRVSWFNPIKRFGFITRDDGRADLFVHASNVLEADDELEAGDVVEFSIGEDPRGRLTARVVRKV